jgi:hypothetical protein
MTLADGSWQRVFWPIRRREDVAIDWRLARSGWFAFGHSLDAPERCKTSKELVGS